jgi:hypothetical protein
VRVRVGVAVLRTHSPLSAQAESYSGVQSSGQAAPVGTLQVLPSQAQQSLGPRVGVRVGVTVFATQIPLARHAELRCARQPSGQAPSSGTEQTFPGQSQQSSSPRGAVGVRVGVLPTQAPLSVQAESGSSVQPVGQPSSVGTLQVLPSQAQQSFAMSWVGVRVGVTVLATQPTVSTQAASKTGSQPCGHS